MHFFIIWYVLSISLSNPIEKRIRPSVSPISFCSSKGISEDVEDTVAVRWFHRPYQQRIQNFQPEKTIYQSSVTGKIGQISRIWHRMYPAIRLLRDPENPTRARVRQTPKYLELIVIFPDNSEKCQDFLNFLDNNSKGFQKLWGN